MGNVLWTIIEEIKNNKISEREGHNLVLLLTLNSRPLIGALSLDSVLQHIAATPYFYHTSPSNLVDINKIGKELNVLPTDELYDLDYILKNIKIAFSDEIPFDDYLAIFNSNRTQKMRNIVDSIIRNPEIRKKPHHNLRRLIDEYNAELEDFTTRRRVKILYGISNFINKNWNAIKGTAMGIGDKFMGMDLGEFGIPDEEKLELKKWFDEKTESLQAFMFGISPEILQLHEVRNELEKIKKET